MIDAANSEVISAFVDNEPFEPSALARALAQPGGRDLLIDFIALRHVVSADGASDSRIAVAPERPRWRGVVAAAAIVAALAGGYAVGRERATLGTGGTGVTGVTEATTGAPVMATAPAPTRVIELRPGVEWQSSNGGR